MPCIYHRRRDLRAGAGHPERLGRAGPFPAGRRYGNVLLTGGAVLSADGTESLQQAGPFWRRRNAGTHHRLFQCRDLPGAGLQIRGLRHRHGGQNVHRGRAGHYLRHAGERGVRHSSNAGTDPDQLGVYFPTDGKLGLEFAQKNDLLRRKDENGAPAGGYLDPEKRNIKALKLRGEKSDGLFLPLSCLASFTDIKKLQEGDTISVLNGITICEKYVPAVKRASGSGGGGNHVRKRSDPISPLFQEHADTEQLAYNLSAFHAGDLVEVTLKMHGTSQRTGYLPVLQGYKYRNRMEKRLYESRKTPNVIRSKIKRAPIYDWGYVTGTRRVVLDTFDEGGFYGNNAFREKHANVFEGKLHKGETVYYEVVGFTDDGTPIMNPGNNSKLNDKEFTKQYGKTTTFSYGCAPDGKEHPKSDLFVYRMTMTNEDGDVVEYPPDFMRYRCEQMGVKCVQVFCRTIIPDFYQLPDDVGSPQAVNAGEYVKKLAENFYDGPDPVGHTHVREGVVCRIVNRPKFAAYKHKNFAFKALEGLIKDTAAAPDMEEAQDVGEQNG